MWRASPENDKVLCMDEDETEATLTVELRRCKCWKNLTTLPLQVLSGEVYLVLQAVGMVLYVAH